MEGRFAEIEDQNPGLSSYSCFIRAIKGQSLSEEDIRLWFDKLVERSDYLPSQKDQLLESIIKDRI